MENAASCASKLNKIVERLNREHRTKTRIAIGLQNILSTKYWCFARDYAVFMRRRTWHTGINSALYFKWHQQPFNHNCLRIFATAGFSFVQQAGKLQKQGSSSLFLSYGSTQTTIYSYDIESSKWYCSPYFRFDATHLSMPSHSLPLSYRNIMSKVKLEDIAELLMDASSSPFDPNAGFAVTALLPSCPLPMHLSFRDDKSFNLPILNKLPQRHPWRHFLPTEHLRDVWILAINDEEPLTAVGTLETLNFIQRNNRTECMAQLHKRETCNGTLLNEYRSLFDQFGRPNPSKILQITKPSAIMHNNKIFTLESHCIVDSAAPVLTPRYYADTLKSAHYYFWKEAAFEHHDQNAAVSLCSIPFALEDLLKTAKCYQNDFEISKIQTNIFLLARAS